MFIGMGDQILKLHARFCNTSLVRLELHNMNDKYLLSFKKCLKDQIWHAYHNGSVTEAHVTHLCISNALYG